MGTIIAGAVASWSLLAVTTAGESAPEQQAAPAQGATQAAASTDAAGHQTSSRGDAAPASTRSQGLYAIEVRLLDRTNAERARYGRPPLKLDRSLLRSARRHAVWMTRTRNVHHTTAPVAENIAMGQRTTAQVMRDWMNSPGHRGNILNSGYTRIGVAAFRTRDGTVFWCQQFLR